MDGAPLVAEGTDSTVSIVGDKVVVQRRGVKSFLKQGFALYKDPGALAGAFEGASKKVVTAALVENRELAKIILGAVKGAGQADDADVTGRALTDALKQNRQAVVQAVKDNDALVKAWLRDHKELAGILLKGDVHVFREDVLTAVLTTGGEGERMLVLAVDGDELKVPYDPSHEADFVRLRDALTDTGAAEVTPSSGAPPAVMKTCPMCAEEVKAAALVCRFCGHRFDEQ
jgi:hypothetical protein